MNHQENYYDGLADYFGDELELECEPEDNFDDPEDDADGGNLECLSCKDENRRICPECGHHSEECEECENEAHLGCIACESLRDEREPCQSCSHYLNCVDCPEDEHYACDDCKNYRGARSQCPRCFHFDADCASCLEEHHEIEVEAGLETQLTSIGYEVRHGIATPAIRQQNVGDKPVTPATRLDNHLAYWTREADELLIDAYNNGDEFKDIANELHRTRNAVLGRLVKLCFRERGIETKVTNFAGADLSNQGTKWAEAEWHLLSFLHSKNESLESMSLSLKRSISAIAYGLVELRLVEPIELDSVSYYSPKNEFQKSRNPWGNADTHNLLVYFRAGEAIEPLARRFNRTVSSVLMKLMSMGELTNDDFDLALNNARERAENF